MNKPFFLVVETTKKEMCAINVEHIITMKEGIVEGGNKTFVTIYMIEGKWVRTFGTVLEIMNLMQRKFNELPL